MQKRQVFYSFHYNEDSWRAGKIRNIGVIEGNRSVSDNDWEEIKNKSGIERWIKEQLKYRSCTIVLIGSNTANRKWINYEIVESWNSRMGVVGINIHGITDSNGYITQKGENPFDYITVGKERLSSIVKTYDPGGANSAEKYAWISRYLSDAVEEAINIRQRRTQ
jgi:hypothetical protein